MEVPALRPPPDVVPAEVGELESAALNFGQRVQGSTDSLCVQVAVGFPRSGRTGWPCHGLRAPRLAVALPAQTTPGPPLFDARSSSAGPVRCRARGRTWSCWVRCRDWHLGSPPRPGPIAHGAKDQTGKPG